MTEGIRKRIFISALESSAEVHCARLIEAADTLARGKYELEWVGLGGSAMAAAGAVLLADTVSRAAMIYNVLTQLGYYHTLRRNAETYLDENPVDLVIVCDSPAFNFHIAKAARRRGIPVLFYVAPQLWAWAPWRIHKLRRCCSQLACILPFEEEWFRSRGVEARFVGNPLFDGLDYHPDECRKGYDGYDPHSPTVALLPGSRQAEIETLWPVMQAVARGLRHTRPGVRFLVSAADAQRLQTLKDRQRADLPVDYRVSDVFGVCRRSDLALVASGSATLQVAAAGCPMAVLYHSSRLLWHLVGRWLIRIPRLSLPNILAGRRLVPEFMPCLPETEVIERECSALLDDKPRLIQISGDLIDLTRPLAASNAADNTARLALDKLTNP